MNILRVGIVEDEEKYRNDLIDYLRKIEESENVVLSVTTFVSCFDFLENKDDDFDILLLDIGLPGMNGMQLAHKIREFDHECKIIFITALQQYAVEGYEVQASDYMVKPVSFSEFKLKFIRLLSKLDFNKNEKAIHLKTEKGSIRLRHSDIIYCETQSHRVIFHTRNGNFEKYDSMRDVEKEMDNPDFIRCNSCYLVNLQMIERIEHSVAYLKNGEELVISRPRLKDTIAAFNNIGK